MPLYSGRYDASVYGHRTDGELKYIGVKLAAQTEKSDSGSYAIETAFVGLRSAAVMRCRACDHRSTDGRGKTNSINGPVRRSLDQDLARASVLRIVRHVHDC